MKKTPPTPANPLDSLTPAGDRRTAPRTHHEPWPEAMREEFRKLQFLAAIEVEEVESDAWRDIFAGFEGRHIRFI